MTLSLVPALSTTTLCTPPNRIIIILLIMVIGKVRFYRPNIILFPSTNHRAGSENFGQEQRATQRPREIRNRSLSPRCHLMHVTLPHLTLWGRACWIIISPGQLGCRRESDDQIVEYCNKLEEPKCSIIINKHRWWWRVIAPTQRSKETRTHSFFGVKENGTWFPDRTFSTKL